ncbi:hypothetical protein NA57DRAFT_76145 [Rhizodiscina lignyota]|uniref:Nitroreductase domain-containing protein n=1 Tax=Rhizodiscina lignyota TaxID=1504668 RepID=A0A9P4IIQ6_9PEZI|nr:hypothetical protein NA57DRAFT_76145 [Rhizodiscina lignyota]
MDFQQARACPPRDFLTEIRAWRTNRELGFDESFDETLLMPILRTTLLHVPSFFNSQTTRIVVLLRLDNKRLWDLISNCLERTRDRTLVPSETYEGLRRLGNANGSVLFYEDTAAIGALLQSPNSARYVGKFQSLIQQTSAQQQFVVQTALCVEGLGGTLHYFNGGLIDEAIKQEWAIEPGWRLVAQIVFGKVLEPVGVKFHSPLDGRLIVKGGDLLRNQDDGGQDSKAWDWLQNEVNHVLTA